MHEDIGTEIPILFLQFFLRKMIDIDVEGTGHVDGLLMGRDPVLDRF